jgi:hypothetical protein
MRRTGKRLWFLLCVKNRKRTQILLHYKCLLFHEGDYGDVEGKVFSDVAAEKMG